MSNQLKMTEEYNPTIVAQGYTILQNKIRESQDKIAELELLTVKGRTLKDLETCTGTPQRIIEKYCLQKNWYVKLNHNIEMYRVDYIAGVTKNKVEFTEEGFNILNKLFNKNTAPELNQENVMLTEDTVYELTQEKALELVKPYFEGRYLTEHLNKNGIINISFVDQRRSILYLEQGGIQFSFSNVDEDVEEWIKDKEYKTHKTGNKDNSYYYYRMRYEELNSEEFVELFNHLYLKAITR